MTTAASHIKVSALTGISYSHRFTSEYSLSHRIYTTALKLPGVTRLSFGRSMDSKVGARVIRRLISLDKKTHQEIARYHRHRAEKLAKIWRLVVERSAQETFGRAFQSHDYKVCAIVRVEFSKEHRRVLRRCAYKATQHRDCAAAHEILARRP